MIKKKSAVNNKNMKNYPVCKELYKCNCIFIDMNEAEESQQPDPNLVNESTGRCVRLALTEGPDGQQIIQEVPEQVCYKLPTFTG